MNRIARASGQNEYVLLDEVLDVSFRIHMIRTPSKRLDRFFEYRLLKPDKAIVYEGLTVRILPLSLFQIIQRMSPVI